MILRTTTWLCVWFAANLLAVQAPRADEPRPEAQPVNMPPADAKPAEEKPESKTDDKGAKDAEPADPNAGDKADALLRYKFVPGGSRTYRVLTNFKHVLRNGETSRETTVEREDLTTRKVLEIDDKGFARVQVGIDAVRVTANIAGQAYEFKSRSKDRARGSSLSKSLDPLFDRLAGGGYVMSVGPQGEVFEVRGYADLVRDVIANNPLAMQLAGGGFNNSARVAAEEQTVIFGNKVVQPGEKWIVPIDLESPSAGRARGTRTFTLVGPDKVGDRPTLRINIATDLVYDILIERDGSRVTGTMTTTESTGVAQFDKAAGELVSLKSSWTLSGTLTAVVNGSVSEIQNEQTHGVTVELQAGGARP